MIVYMKNEYLGHFFVNVFVCALETVNIGMLGYSSDPMHNAYYVVENNKEFQTISINLLCCHFAEEKMAEILNSLFQFENPKCQNYDTN